MSCQVAVEVAPQTGTLGREFSEFSELIRKEVALGNAEPQKFQDFIQLFEVSRLDEPVSLSVQSAALDATCWRRVQPHPAPGVSRSSVPPLTIRTCLPGDDMCDLTMPNYINYEIEVS
jgi:hypothetical protein